MRLASTNEWSPLKQVLVGRAEYSCFPNEPPSMVSATMPPTHHHHFKSSNAFPATILSNAAKELDHFTHLLEKEGIKTYRPKTVDWLQVGGYTGAMPRDGLLVVGNTIIEACFAWRSRSREVELALGQFLDVLERDPANVVLRAPRGLNAEGAGIYSSDPAALWAINESRPAFDAADFMRFGNVILGQLSHVTNRSGVEYLRSVIPSGYTIELVEVEDRHAMHIDATLLPLKHGLLVFNPQRISEEALRKHSFLQDWKIMPCPILPNHRASPPYYMTSGWLFMNLLSIDESRAFVEESDVEMADWIRSLGITPILCPFKNVQSIGGSFHCATVDLERSASHISLQE
jgi:glycine amidinotransferase